MAVDGHADGRVGYEVYGESGMRIQRVGERVLYTNPAVRVVHPRSAAVAIPWYLSGGIAAANYGGIG